MAAREADDEPAPLDDAEPACLADAVAALGLRYVVGKTDEALLDAMRDLRAHHVDILTIGQYLVPSRFHMPVRRYVTPTQFDAWCEAGLEMGFREVVAGPLVRSSYQADRISDAALARGANV